MRKETRDKILDVSYQLCNTYGFWSLKVEDILNNAGISRATFYKYFKNTNDVVDTLFDQELEETTKRIEFAVAQETGPFEKLRAFLLAEITGMRKFFVSVRFDELDVLPPIPRARMHRQFVVYGEIVKKILAEGMADGSLDIQDMDIAVRGVLSFSRDIGAVSMMNRKSAEEIHREIEMMLELLFNGILPRRSGSP
ncbi:MAG: TetR/AcrR family transcriptional regulator [Deltaproteobacteria bacterium]|nr:TetR/AcrR family transcriptional regulator [Candidatus Zymogenaceae bacterium]